MGILIDPEQLTLTVYRLHQELILLQNNYKLTLPDLLPAWELTVSEILLPMFE
ncbi:hypothetical protein NIES2111_07700 [Nostoc sp. NIES-2111]|nr:hypothetical protein NIES2111_07700 [Nostoc sp. NIES-2111]